MNLKALIFKDMQYLKTIQISSHYQGVIARYNINQHNQDHPKDIPMDSFVFVPSTKHWYVKLTRKALRPAPDILIPKELKLLLLIMGVPQ